MFEHYQNHKNPDVTLRSEAYDEILAEEYPNYDGHPFDDAETQRFEHAVDVRVSHKLAGLEDSLFLRWLNSHENSFN